MDVVCNSDLIDVAFLETKLKRYGYPVSRNSNVLSFLFNSFQIDLIFVKSDIFEYSWNYFNFLLALRYPFSNARLSCM